MTCIASINQLSVKYDGVHAVDNVNLDVGEGQILGLVGPNGAGKTTLFRAMLGLQAHGGSVSLLGHDQSTRKRVMPFIGYVPQKMSFEPAFPATVRDVVAMGLSRKPDPDIIVKKGFKPIDLFGCNTAARRIEEALVAVDMQDNIHRRIGTLSGGEQQRVFIAQSLVRNPLLLILDEPVASMDVESQNTFYDIIKKANRDHGITVIISLHNLDMLREHSDMVACMNCSLSFHGNTDAFFADEDCLKMYTEASMQACLSCHDR